MKAGFGVLRVDFFRTLQKRVGTGDSILSDDETYILAFARGQGW